GVEPLEFDGVHDAVLHPFSGDGSEYMEYIQDHGWFADLPLDRIFASYEGFRFDDSDKIVDQKFACPGTDSARRAAGRIAEPTGSTIGQSDRG
ncbi:hypothetical protein, partial [Agromyces bauzanensis]